MELAYQRNVEALKAQLGFLRHLAGLDLTLEPDFFWSLAEAAVRHASVRPRAH